MNHTPGPWLVKQCFETGIGIMDSDDKKIVAEVWPMRDYDEPGEDIRTDEVAQNNARLIAVTPQMLEVCEELCNTVAENGELNFRSADLSLQQVREMAMEIVSALQSQ